MAVRTLRAQSTPEAIFVILCARERCEKARLMEAARSVLCWETVADMAARHRVAAYVLAAAAQCGLESSEPAFARLSAESISRQAVTMLLNSELERIVGRLGAASVPLLVLKGPVLARTIYVDPAFRPFADLDLSVQARHEHEAASALLGLGYTELGYETGAGHPAHAGHDDGGTFHRLFAGVFAGADNRALVELHLDPLQLGVAPVCEAERWARALPVPGLDDAKMLCPEDQIVQLSVHAQKHGYSRLIWLKDLDLLLRAHADHLDWPQIVEVARREGVAGSVWYTLGLTAVLLGTPVGTGALKALRPALPVRLLYRLVWPRRRVIRLEGFLRRRAVQFHAADSLRGMLPSLILMGRRATRTRLLLASLFGR